MISIFNRMSVDSNNPASRACDVITNPGILQWPNACSCTALQSSDYRCSNWAYAFVDTHSRSLYTLFGVVFHLTIQSYSSVSCTGTHTSQNTLYLSQQDGPWCTYMLISSEIYSVIRPSSVYSLRWSCHHHQHTHHLHPPPHHHHAALFRSGSVRRARAADRCRNGARDNGKFQ